MPLPPDQKRVIFPFRGASDRFSYIETPGDMAPIGLMQNVEPRDVLGGRERGGQRAGIRDDWGALNGGPVQAIVPLSQPARQTGTTLGACIASHAGYESHLTGNLIGNMFILRGRTAKPAMSRHLAVGGAGFETPTARDLTALVWTGGDTVAGGVNEDPPATDLDNIVFKATFAAAAGNEGFGTPGWTEFSNFDPGGAVVSVNGGPWPIETCDVLYGDSVLGTALFASHTVTAGFPVTETRNKGFVAAYDTTGTGLVTVPAGKHNYLRIFGKVYNEAVTGTPSSLHAVSISANPGAIEVPALLCQTSGGVKSLYFCYAANPDSEAMVGRFDVGSFSTTGFDLNAGLSGAFQVNGAGFAVAAATFTPTASALDPHFLALNYPRGARPMGVAVDPLGFVYFIRSSTGWGPNYAAGTNPSHHPYFTGYTPITVCKVDPTGAYFVWEASTRADLTQTGPGIVQVANPELRAVAADADACYCVGREIRGANAFALGTDDAAELWTWRSCAVAGGSFLYCVAIDPDDGNLWVAGDRTNTYQGVVASAYANLWKLDRLSGAVLIAHDIGPGIGVLSLDINQDTGLMAVGTFCTDSP